MKIKSIVSIITTVLLVVVCSNPVFATVIKKEDNIKNLRDSIENEFKTWIGPLEADKETFNLKENEFYSSAYLGDEIPYYQFKDEKLNRETLAKINPNINFFDYFRFTGYSFPVFVNERQVATAKVEKVKGKYTIFAIGSNDLLEKKINQAAEKIKGGEEYYYIDDHELYVQAVVAKDGNGYKVASIDDNPMTIFSDENEIISLEETIIKATNILEEHRDLQKERSSEYNLKILFPFFIALVLCYLLAEIAYFARTRFPHSKR